MRAEGVDMRAEGVGMRAEGVGVRAMGNRNEGCRECGCGLREWI